MGINFKKAALILLTFWVSNISSVSGQTSSSLDNFNTDPLRPRGQNVIPLYEGWFPNPDGTYTLCFGYFNMNTEQTLDVPIGERNRVEPAMYDGLQPTHFDPLPDPELTRFYRHHWCVFSVTVPADFGNSDVTWTLETQGNQLSVPGSLIPAYVMDEQATSGRDAIAPYLSLNDDPPSCSGRRGLWEGPRIARVGEPMPLIARIRHPHAGTWLGWTQHQRPAAVQFSESEIRLDTPDGAATTMATFSEPGSYIVRVQAINDTERRENPTYGFEFYCCWTNGYVRVDVVE